jgi:transposase
MSRPKTSPPITRPEAPDLEAVRRFIVDMIGRGAVTALVAAIIELLSRMRDLNTELMAKLTKTSRKRPPSETWQRLQLELPLLVAQPAANDDATSALSPPLPEPPLPAQPEKKRRGPKTRHLHGRPKLPAHLPRVPDVQPLPAALRTCPECGVAATTIGFKTAEKLDIVPARFVVTEIQRETCACQSCRRYVRTAPKGDEVLDRGILGNELLVQSLVDHYDDAVPWERMERSARQQGVPLSANTLAASIGRVVDLFAPIVEHIGAACLASSFTALDATSMPVLDEGRAPGIRTSALWLIEGDHRYAFYMYAPSGHAKHLEEWLEGHTLASVMCDGSPTNNCVERAGGQRGGCNSHGRRGLVEALRLGDARAAAGLEIYRQIFHVDAESKRLGESREERFARRKAESAPLVEQLRRWIERSRAAVEPKVPLGRALGYLHRQWARLTAFLRDPLMELTNNEVESGLRRWVLHRKTCLFVGHDLSARRAADALTLLGTCRKMGIEPRRYLRETLAKILAGEKNLRALLPENFRREIDAHVATNAA